MVRILTTAEGLPEAARILRDGGLVGVPTETVYGLAADAGNAQAVANIYAAKGRPSFNPLIVHIADVAMAKGLATFDPVSQALTEKFWPGPLTLVLPLAEAANVAPSVTAGLGTIALRQPVGVLADLAAELGNGVAAPSANSSGRISATSAQHVADDLGTKIDLILDGGTCAVGVESTIVKVSGGEIVVLRAGGITAEQLATVAPISENAGETKIEAPGQLLAHYAPRIPLRMNASHINENEAQLAFGPTPLQGGRNMLNLSVEGDLAEAARNLFSMMKQLDDTGSEGIAVQPIPATGIGVAINDRLRRAAHGSLGERSSMESDDG